MVGVLFLLLDLENTPTGSEQGRGWRSDLLNGAFAVLPRHVVGFLFIFLEDMTYIDFITLH